MVTFLGAGFRSGLIHNDTHVSERQLIVELLLHLHVEPAGTVKQNPSQNKHHHTHTRTYIDTDIHNDIGAHTDIHTYAHAHRYTDVHTNTKCVNIQTHIHTDTYMEINKH